MRKNEHHIRNIQSHGPQFQVTITQTRLPRPSNHQKYKHCKIQQTSRIPHHSQRLQPTCYPPLFKSVPPPNYHLLQQLVLQDYPRLHFTSPRFITLRHPTLQNLLMRTRLTPTDEQFLDINLYLNNNAATAHTTTATLRNTRHQQ